MKTLLQKAKDVKRASSITEITPEIIELAVAWAREEIGFTDAEIALSRKKGSARGTYAILARALKAYIRQGTK